MRLMVIIFISLAGLLALPKSLLMDKCETYEPFCYDDDRGDNDGGNSDPDYPNEPDDGPDGDEGGHNGL